MKKTILILLLSIFVISCNNKKVTSSGDDPYIMAWSIAKDAGISLTITGGTEWEGQAISPGVGASINAGYPYDYVIFQSINVDIYTGASSGGQKLGSTTINMVTDSGGTYPLDSKGLLKLAYNKDKSTYPGPTAWQNKNYFDVTYNSVPPPSVITNKGWNNGLGNQDETAITNESFFVADYGDENGRWTVNGGAIYQTTKEISNNAGSRIYAVETVKGDDAWSYEAGVGVGMDGLWQIDIKIGSDGNAPFCETFYLAERRNLTPGVDNYLDGQGGQSGTSYGREIDVMETQWKQEGPQSSLANDNSKTQYWNQTELQNVQIGSWSDIGGAPNPDFATYGVLIRDNNLWIYSYKPDGSVWFSSDAVPNTNKTYQQQGPFVAYIGTWRKDPQTSTTGFSTGYNNFIYLAQDDAKIAGKNPKDNPEAFGNALK